MLLRLRGASQGGYPVEHNLYESLFDLKGALG